MPHNYYSLIYNTDDPVIHKAIKSSHYAWRCPPTTQIGCDSAHRVTQITYPDTRAVIAYSYDGVGHLTKVESLWGTGADEVFYEASGFNACTNSV